MTAPMLLAVLSLVSAFGRFGGTESRGRAGGARRSPWRHPDPERGGRHRPGPTTSSRDRCKEAPPSCAGTRRRHHHDRRVRAERPVRDETLNMLTVTVSCTVDTSDLAFIPLGSIPSRGASPARSTCSGGTTRHEPLPGRHDARAGEVRRVDRAVHRDRRRSACCCSAGWSSTEPGSSTRRGRATAYAEEAARAGVQRILLDIGDTKLDEESGVAAVATYCEAARRTTARSPTAGHDVVVQSDSPTNPVSVTVGRTSRHRPMLLSMIGIGRWTPARRRRRAPAGHQHPAEEYSLARRDPLDPSVLDPSLTPGTEPSTDADDPSPPPNCDDYDDDDTLPPCEPPHCTTPRRRTSGLPSWRPNRRTPPSRRTRPTPNCDRKPSRPACPTAAPRSATSSPDADRPCVPASAEDDEGTDAATGTERRR